MIILYSVSSSVNMGNAHIPINRMIKIHNKKFTGKKSYYGCLLYIELMQFVR